MANIEALQQAVRVLKETKRKGRKFDIRFWLSFSNDFYNRKTEEYNTFSKKLEDLNISSSPKEFEEIRNSCDTVGCVIGWCMLDPWFRERGFSIKRKVPFSPTSDSCHWDAVTNFFHLSEGEVRNLFYPGNNNPDDIDFAIKRIQDFISIHEG